MCS
ncbi:unnamed protein product [Linum tenue]|jgi:hypothetical protein